MQFELVPKWLRVLLLLLLLLLMMMLMLMLMLMLIMMLIRFFQPSDNNMTTMSKGRDPQEVKRGGASCPEARANR